MLLFKLDAYGSDYYTNTILSNQYILVKKVILSVFEEGLLNQRIICNRLCLMRTSDNLKVGLTKSG